MTSTTDCLPIAIVSESDDETRGLIRSLLELLGFAVVEAYDSEAVYESAVCYRPDVILIELNLQIVNGFSTIRRIRKKAELSNIPIIAMSSEGIASNPKLAIAAGCSAHVQKPIKFDWRESVVEELVPCERLSIVSCHVH